MAKTFVEDLDPEATAALRSAGSVRILDPAGLAAKAVPVERGLPGPSRVVHRARRGVKRMRAQTTT